MRIAQTLPLALAVVGLGCAGAATAPSLPLSGPIAFVQGDRIEIDVRLMGCFHDYRVVVALRIDGDSAIVEEFSGRGNLPPGHRFAPVTALSAGQVVGLGELLEDYRRPAAGWCTESERGHIRLARDGEPARSQDFADSSCRWLGENAPAFSWYMLADVVPIA